MTFARNALAALLGAAISFVLLGFVTWILGKAGLTPLGRLIRVIAEKSQAGKSVYEILSDPQVVGLIIQAGHYGSYIILPSIAVVVGLLVGSLCRSYQWIWGIVAILPMVIFLYLSRTLSDWTVALVMTGLCGGAGYLVGYLRQLWKVGRAPTSG